MNKVRLSLFRQDNKSLTIICNIFYPQAFISCCPDPNRLYLTIISMQAFTPSSGQYCQLYGLPKVTNYRKKPQNRKTNMHNSNIKTLQVQCAMVPDHYQKCIMVHQLHVTVFVYSQDDTKTYGWISKLILSPYGCVDELLELAHQHPANGNKY